MNDERTARAGINYGMGAVKGLPFNGIEANIDAVAQTWAQYNVDNNVFEHCHPTMANMDCPAGRIAGAYPNNCTEFGGGIENLHASSSGTIAQTDVLLDAIIGWIYEDAGSAWGHRHAMLAQGYDDDYGEAMQEGFVGFGIAQTANMAVQWQTVVVVNFTNPVADAQAAGCGYNVTVTTNSLTGAPCATPPTINSVTKVDPPDCNNMTGSITVNAVGNGTLQYSVDGGASWQAGNIFNNLMPGNYNVSVGLQAMQNCVTTYNANPVVINSPMGCNGNCTDYPLANLNLNIPNNSPAGVTSTINVPTAGTVTDINIKGLNGTHTYVGALTFSLRSPMGTTIVLIANDDNCNTANFNITLDDQAANQITCLDNAGNTVRPQNALSGFNGQNAQGNWVLTVADVDAEADNGALNGWTLAVCALGAPALGYTCATAIDINAAGTYNAPGPNQGNGAIDASIGAVHANWYRFTPPMTGMIRIFTCGLANGGNNHNHIYLDATNCPTNTNNVVHTADRGCAGDPNNPALGVLLENVPVTAGVPIFIEWDDAGGNTATFTWTLEYMGGGPPCAVPTYVNGCEVDMINSFTFGAYSNLNTGCGGDLPNNLTDYKPQGPTVQPGQTYPVTCAAGTENQYYTVYIDFNNNGSYLDPGEFFNIGQAQANGNVMANVVIPANATAGTLSMRVRSAYNNDDTPLTAADACQTQLDYGEIEEYNITIQGGTPCPTNVAKNEMNIASGSYQAGTQLTSSGAIGAGNNVTFRAGNNVELQNNFTVPQTAVLEVKIEGCQ